MVVVKCMVVIRITRCCRTSPNMYELQGKYMVVVKYVVVIRITGLL